MDKEIIIIEGLKDWAAYSRRKLTPRVEEMYKDIFLPYSKKTIRQVFKDHLKFGEKFPFIHEVSAKLSKIEVLFIDYDKTEDQRFPIGKMWEGFRILEKHGKDAFYNYANSVYMPLNDRQRVIAKHEQAYNVNDLL
ncbi:unnamed protein product [marine sediment metagenome]|uniref:Uncharacterized protein n=1 Tax=marine sediment metagenome TaxID=412755 RepID=X0SGT0_9ZZZZ